MCAETRAGRPTKLSASVAQQLVDALRDGADLTNAARAAGIGRRTLYDWLALGRRQPHGLLLGRIEEVLAARATPGPGTWQDALAVLEHEYPDRWALPPLDDVLDDVLSTVDDV